MEPLEARVREIVREELQRVAEERRGNPDEFVKPAVLAREGGVTRTVVALWCRQGLLKAQRVGSRWVVRRGDWDAFVAGRRPRNLRAAA